MRNEDLIAPLRAAYHRGDYVLGEKFKVHTIDRGTREQMQKLAYTRQKGLDRYLNRHFELGLFVVSVKESPDPLGGWDIFVEYHGEAKTASTKSRWQGQRRRKRRGSRTTEG